MVAACERGESPNQLQGFEVPTFGSSGTRYVVTLATVLHLRHLRHGVLGVCVGSGRGIAPALENASLMQGTPVVWAVQLKRARRPARPALQ